MDTVVVSGGRSRRLGHDKAVLMRGDRRQVDHVVDGVRPLGGLVVVARGARPLDVTDTLETPDEPGMVGPLAGVVAGLRLATTSLVAVVAVDLVQPDASLLLALAAHVRRDGLVGGMPEVGTRPQPLHAVVHRDLVGALAATGPSLVGAMDDVGVSRVPEAVWRPWSPSARPDHDLDTPDDLACLDVEQEPGSPDPSLRPPGCVASRRR